MLFAFPLLSLQAVTFEPLSVKVVASPPSNQSKHGLDTSVGLNVRRNGLTMLYVFLYGCVIGREITGAVPVPCNPHFHAKYPSICWRSDVGKDAE